MSCLFNKYKYNNTHIYTHSFNNIYIYIHIYTPIVSQMPTFFGLPKITSFLEMSRYFRGRLSITGFYG